MMKCLLLLSVFFGLVILQSQASNLPACPSNIESYWTDCFGTYTASNGEIIIGEWKYDKIHGQGTNIFPSGEKYVGEFRDGKRNGQGTYTYANGSREVGEFRDDKLHGEAIEYNADGSIFRQGVYKDNEFQYAKKIKPYTQINIPDNAHVYGDTWKCNSGYFKYGESCLKIPDNAVASGDSWKCKSGYKKVGDTCKAKVSSEELIAAQKKAAELEQQLAQLQAEKKNKLQQISTDNQIPLIDILSAISSGKQGIVKGRATDNVEVAEVTIDGITIPIDSNGYFEHKTYIQEGGTTLTIEAFDMAGLSSSVTVPLKRTASVASNTINFDRLNPLGKRVSENNDALALVIGVSDYENIDAQAVYADSDARIFSDYAADILGIPNNRIKTLVNDGADIRDVLLGVKNWLRRSMKPKQSDVYLFFAGHGLASSDGKDMYLLPYDGSPELLDKTAILRKELFHDITSANPRSVTVFLDTCYSGTTRGTDMLIASRPIAIVAKEKAIPDNFTVFTAAAGDQTAKPLEEAKHGLFSYFLMKGMEGEADSNKDNSITASELHAYVQQNVIQQSSGSQTPELQGDANRVLVRFQ